MANSKPRILIAASIYPPDPGGPAIHAKRQYEWFKAHGIETEVVALAHYRQLPKFIRHFAYLCALLNKANRYGVIYAHDALGVGIPALLVAKILRKKFVIRIGGDLAWEREAEQNKTSLSMIEWYEAGEHRHKGIYVLIRIVLSNADLIIVPTVLLSNVYKKYYGVSEQKLHTLPNPIPDKHINEVKTEQTIIYASRLVAYKNLNFAIKAFSDVINSNSRKDVKFIIMGDGPERSRLESLVKLLGLDSQVIFLGSVSQDKVLEETSKSLFTIAPALTEFNPNYVLQGIALGKPFLISREHGLPFVVPEELKFNPRDQSDLEQKILHLLDPAVYSQVKESIGNIYHQFTWEDNLGANLRAIEKI